MKIVDAAAQSCQAPIGQQPTATAPNWDAMANSFASLSTAIGWGALIVAVISLLVAIILFVGGLAWGKVIAQNAEREARDMAKVYAEDHISKWLANSAPGIIRERVDLIIDATLGPDNDADAADEIGKGA